MRAEGRGKRGVEEMPDGEKGGMEQGEKLTNEEALVSDDAVALWNAAGRPGDLSAVCPQRFEAPLAPHLAARAGREAQVAMLNCCATGLDFWRERSEVLIVEGAGGLMSPISDDDDTWPTWLASLACHSWWWQRTRLASSIKRCKR